MRFIFQILLLLALPAGLSAAEVQIARVEKNALRIKAGSAQGLKPGMKFDVLRQEEQMVHPITGEQLGSPKVKIAEAQITKVYRTSALARVTSSYAPIEPGDLVRPVELRAEPPAPPPAAPPPAASAGVRVTPAVTDYVREVAERLTKEIVDLQSKISSLTKTLGRISKIEGGIARMQGEIGAMKSNVSSLRGDVDSLKKASAVPEVLRINQDNLEEFKTQHADLNVAVRSGRDALLLPVDALAHILLPYVNQEQRGIVDSLVQARIAELKATTGPAATEHAEVKETRTEPEAHRVEEHAADELQGLLEEDQEQ